MLMSNLLQCATWLSSIAITILATNGLRDNSCTDLCDQTNTDGLLVNICGTDFVNHTTHSSSFESNCYDQCYVMTQYQGSCGCPNDCYQSYGQGRCENSKCVCINGFTGDDCSLPTSGHSCSNHGKIVDDNFPFFYCECDNGFTGTDCSTPVFSFGSTPWGTLFPGDVYSDKDDYGDDHPIWNISVLATIRLDLNPDDYLYLLNPQNLESDIYFPCTMHFDSGRHNVQTSIENVGMRLKGASSRLQQKKGWTLKFNEFTSGGKFYDMKKIGLKPGNTDDDGLAKQMLYSDFLRAVGVPTQRSSYALLYINNQFVGLYNMQEDISPEFVENRISGDGGEGNTYKFFWRVVLQYFGSDPAYYQTQATINDMGEPWYWYEQSDGDGDWTDLINLLYFLNTSSEYYFIEHIEEVIDLDILLRILAVESFMLAGDNIASGNNYYLYKREDSSPLWMIFEFDFDECFSVNPATMQPDEQPTDIFDFFLAEGEVDYDEANPLLIRMFSIPKYHDTYVSYYKTFLEGTFGSDSNQQPADRFAAYSSFIAPWLAKDNLWQISFGMTMDAFASNADTTTNYLPIRYADVTNQLKQL